MQTPSANPICLYGARFQLQCHMCMLWNYGALHVAFLGWVLLTGSCHWPPSVAVWFWLREWIVSLRRTGETALPHILSQIRAVWQPLFNVKIFHFCLFLPPYLSIFHVICFQSEEMQDNQVHVKLNGRLEIKHTNLACAFSWRDIFQYILK